MVVVVKRLERLLSRKPFTAFWFVFTLFAVAVLWRMLQSAPR